MKNQINRLRKHSILKGIHLLFCVFAIILSTTSCNGQPSPVPQPVPSPVEPIHVQTASDSICKHVQTILQNEGIKKGKTSPDGMVVFLSARDSNEAFKQAQNLCIKLNAQNPKQAGDTTTYELPNNSRTITFKELKDNSCIYGILYLNIPCNNYAVKEIRYIRQKCYKEL